MKILLMRHGESKSQAKQIELCAPDSINGLTDHGVEQIKETAAKFDGNINAVYASPYKRTVLTAQIFLNEIGINKQIITDDRLREIDYGYHGGEAVNKAELTDVAIKQIAGDYDIRFGKTGENKREIVTRFFDFIVDIFSKHDFDETILAVSHGRAISILNYEFCQINNMPVNDNGTKNAQIKEFILTKECISNIEKRLKALESKTI